MIGDIIIIYLACGAPLGVYTITSKRAPLTVSDWASFIHAFLFWPLFAAVVLYRLIRGQRQIDHEKLDQIRREIEESAFPGRHMAELFDFREIFYRFTGLAEIAYIRNPKGRSCRLFAATGHRNIRLAEKCLDRRDAARLAFHTELAQREFSELISACSTDRAMAIKLSYLASQIAQVINFEAVPSQRLETAPVQSAKLTDPHAALRTVDGGIAVVRGKRLGRL